MRDTHVTRFRPPGLGLRLYRTLSPALCQAAELATPFSAKLAQGIEGRRDLMSRLLAAGPSLQGCVWFHVTSVGEYEQARPIIAAMREKFPETPLAVTHYSPSGRQYAQKRPCADFHDYLPLDHPRLMDRLVRAWRPRLLVFVKFDCWPNQVLAADQQGVPIVLLAGSLQPASTRLKPVARNFFRDLFNRFGHLGVCTPEDQERFQKGLEVSCPVTVTGDTRAEQVIKRYEASAEGQVARSLQNLGGKILVLGSTWPPDENLWLPIAKPLLEAQPNLRMVLTPHEPLPHRLRDLEDKLDHLGLEHIRLSELVGGLKAATARIILVDSIGVLAEIYRAGHLAYVGGSFTTGVHNTMEPAIAGMPVMFGPVIGNAEEAGRMVQLAVGFVLRKPEEALAVAGKLLADSHRLHELGQQARQVVLDQRGATQRSMAVISPYLEPQHNPTANHPI